MKVAKLLLVVTFNLLYSNVSLTIESLTTQNEYFTSYSGEEYLWGTLEIGVTTDEDISGFSMGISHYNGMGVGLPYGGLVEEYDFEMTNLFGSLIGGGHNMFPQDYYIPTGTTDETLMYVSILISETNDEEFCILPGDFISPWGGSLNVILNENSCISIDEMCLDEDYDRECDIASIVGDINSDNVINVVDVIQIVNISLGTQDFDLAADLNEDGAVNVLDVVSLVNIILN